MTEATREVEPRPEVSGRGGSARRVRRARLALLALLLVTGLLAAGLLFVHYRLSGMTASFRQDLLARVGFPVQVEAVEVNGLRGVRLRNVYAQVSADDGTRVVVSVPECRIDIDLVDLTYGQVNVERLHLNAARFTVLLPEQPAPLDQPRAETAGTVPADARDPLAFLPELPPMPFRVTGNGCLLDLQNLFGDADLRLGELAFDVVHLPDSTRLTGTVSALLDNAPEKAVHASLAYASPTDFDVTLQLELLTTADINRFGEGPEPLLVSGSGNAVLRLTGYPTHQITLHAQAAFEHVAATYQPDFLRPFTGTFTGLITYDANRQTLSISTAKVDASQLAGELSGHIDLDSESPMLDLEAYTGDLPLTQVLEEFAPENLAQGGALSVSLEEPSEFRVSLQGPMNSPEVKVNARLAGGTFGFSPSVPGLPAVNLALGGTTISWSPEGGFSEATAQIRGGRITHDATGFSAQELTGALRFNESTIALDPISIMVTGNPFIGRLNYDLEGQRGEFDLNGTLANIEDTVLANPEKKTELAGSLALRCKGTVSASEYQFDVSLDATQAHIQHDWFLDKPAGVGTTFKGVSVTMTPRSGIEVLGTLDMASAQANFSVALDWRDEKYQLTRIRARAEPFDIVMLNQVVRLPYALSGTELREGFLEWDRVGSVPESTTVAFGGALTEAGFLPETGEQPLRVRDGQFRVTLDNTDPANRKGAIAVEAAWANLPPFGEPWFIPLRTDPELLEKYPDQPRDMTLAVDVAEITAPPWAAASFTARGGFDQAVMHLDHFAATLPEGGQISGSYHLEKGDNLTTVKARWQDIPASPILWHMKLPGAMEARATGAIEYQVDNDDPNTLEGEGDLHFYEGKFSADYLFERLRAFLQDDPGALPPSLRFSQLDFDLALDGDIITTNNIRLALEGITITGDGQFVTNADMDYTLTATISPDTAARMPVFRDYFNVEGHRVSQNELALTFQIAGPSFSPSSEVVGLPPVGVTVVSGAAELGSEALKVIDTPRQILLDLFRIGGAIVGGGG